MKPALSTGLLAAAALAAFGLPSLAATPVSPYSAVYVFGDSLSDSGNNALAFGADASQVITGNTYIPTHPYGSGVYSNSSVWVSAFTAGLGLPASATPSLGGGGDYAYGGARTTTEGGFGGGFPPSATTQLAGTGPAPFQIGYLFGKPSVPATALYVIAIGSNDVSDVAEAVAGSLDFSLIGPAAAAYAAGVGDMVDALQAKGAARIVVWDTPDLGKTPAALFYGPGFSGLATGVSAAFNGALSARLAGEAGVSMFDVFGATDAIIADPGAYGLTNVTDACGALGAGCDPSKYLFWDGIHPTSAGHALIADAMLAAVPEPSSMLMLAVGIGALLAWRRRA